MKSQTTDDTQKDPNQENRPADLTDDEQRKNRFCGKTDFGKIPARF